MELEWNDVNEVLPQIRCLVAIVDPQGREEVIEAYAGAVFSGETSFTNGYGKPLLGDVTHWLPYPEFPDATNPPMGKKKKISPEAQAWNKQCEADNDSGLFTPEEKVALRDSKEIRKCCHCGEDIPKLKIVSWSVYNKKRFCSRLCDYNQRKGTRRKKGLGPDAIDALALQHGVKNCLRCSKGFTNKSKDRHLCDYCWNKNKGDTDEYGASINDLNGL